MFACPECGYTANADHNASVNLHRRFYGELPEVAKAGDGVYKLTRPGRAPVKVEAEEVRTKVAPRADSMCRGKATF